MRDLPHADDTGRSESRIRESSHRGICAEQSGDADAIAAVPLLSRNRERSFRNSQRICGHNRHNQLPSVEVGGAGSLWMLHRKARYQAGLST